MKILDSNGAISLTTVREIKGLSDRVLVSRFESTVAGIDSMVENRPDEVGEIKEGREALREEIFCRFGTGL